MTILFILLLNTVATGMEFHEIAGIVILALFIFHNLLNLNWIKGITKNVFKRKANTKTIFMYVLDILLTISLTGTVLSGVFISRVLFTSLSVPFTEFWDAIHSPLAYLSLILISIHLGLHWQYIMASFRKMLGLKKDSVIRRRLSRLVALVIVLLGIKSSIENNIAGKIVPQLSLDSVGTAKASDTTISAADLDENSDGVQVASSVTESTQSLEDYLGSLHCTGCHKHCSLLSPQCSVGVKQAQEAKTAYYASISAADTATPTATATAAPTSKAEVTSTPNKTKTTTSSGTTGTTSGMTTQLSVISWTNSMFDTFADYVPIMGVWIAGVHYFIMAKERSKKASG